ncbi:MAG: HAD domain-containing protein [Pontimonas sp.]
MSKPFLFLDIDGVLNSFGGQNVWGDDEDHALTPFGQGPFVVSISMNMARAINSLDCELWWTTTWQTEAYLVGDIIGLKGQYLDLDVNPGWKHGAVQRMLQDDPRPFVWFEDEPGIYGTNNGVSRDKWPPGFVWNPNALTGITPSNIEGARRFLRENR